MQVGNDHSKDLMDKLFGPEGMGNSGQVLQHPFKPSVRDVGVGSRCLTAGFNVPFGAFF